LRGRIKVGGRHRRDASSRKISSRKRSTAIGSLRHMPSQIDPQGKRDTYFHAWREFVPLRCFPTRKCPSLAVDGSSPIIA
jgi:hypothetical protein